MLGQPDPLPPGSGWLLLLEVADGGTAESFGEVSERVVAVATDPAQRQRLWALRERQTEIYSNLPGVSGPSGPADLGGLVKLDVSLRLRDLDAAVAGVRAVVAQAGREQVAGGGRNTGRGSPDPGGDALPWVGFFGHALDGNLHVQLVGAEDDVADRILEAVAALGGSISAEHGIGRMKAAHLHLARSEEQIDWMRRIKSTVDPDGSLNPGVLLHEVLLASGAQPVDADPTGSTGPT